MSHRAPFPSVVPMPYLTPLYKEYVNDPASIRHHIFHPLERIWQIANFHIDEDYLNDPAARLVALAIVKEQFTILVSYSSASPDLKRALFQLPLEDIFDKCVSCFCIFARTIDEVARWFAGCASHPQADVDNSLAGNLCQYTMLQSKSSHISVPANFATYAADPSFCGNFIHMKHALQQINEELGEPAYVSVLEAFVQLGANVVDMFLFVDHYKASHGPGIGGIVLDGLDCVTWAWENMLDSPFGEHTPFVRSFLFDRVQITPLASAMLNHIEAKVRVKSVEKNKHKLHAVMWTSILHYAANLSGLPRRKLGAVIKNAVKLEADQKKLILASLAGELSEVDRPVRTIDQITAELSARVAQFYGDEDESQDIPIEAVGPEMDPRTLGRSITEKQPADETCPVCRGEFSGTEDPILALNACGHLFHVDCLDPWVNRVELGLNTIQCPYCRTRLCDARDYRGVVEE